MTSFCSRLDDPSLQPAFDPARVDIAKLQASGLGDQAASWIGKGENLPIGGDQIEALLGSDKLQAIAGQLGLGTGEAAGGLANLLPQVVDKLTPEGSIPEGNPADLLGSLKGLLG